MIDYIIVGAGLSGSVLAERIATQQNKKVLIIEKRNHIGGNCYDYYNNDGILIHKYGPHWFHTNSNSVWDYLSKFTEWIKHDHIVKSNIDHILYDIPINRNTINKLYNLDLKTDEQIQMFYDRVRDYSITNPKNAEEQVLKIVGEDLYKKFFKYYTEKQWGIKATDLDASVTARIPIRINNDGRYFTDKYQGIPRYGYTKMFENILSNKNISILLNTDYKDFLKTEIKFEKLVYTGPIDYFFDYKYGKLPYRSLKFQHETNKQETYQPYQQINYPNSENYTRIVEYKHVTKQVHPYTTIVKEYPCQANEYNEPYYPIPNPNNKILYQKYKEDANKLHNTLICGRLGNYLYYNMDQVVAESLSLFEKSKFFS